MAKARIHIPEEIAPFLVAEDCADFPINRYILTANQQEIYEDIIDLQETVEEMHELGMDYLNTTLLYGGSGTGKTTFGRYLAYTLDKDFVYINFANLLDGIFGSTTRNLEKIFQFIATANCVFMLDEIDCIAVKRGEEDSATGGELSRITISLMQDFDKCKRDRVKTIILGGTNRLDRIDPALLSRFSITKEIKLMTNSEKQQYIENFLQEVKIPYSVENIKRYCAENSLVNIRNVEADISRCTVRWIKNNKQDFCLERIR